MLKWKLSQTIPQTADWMILGYVQKDKIPKMSSALTENEIKSIKLDITIYRRAPNFSGFTSMVTVVKANTWLSNDSTYHYNKLL